MKWIIKKEHEGMLLRDYLSEVLELSGRLIKRAKSGKIMINAEEKTVRYMVKAGDELSIQLAEKRSDKMEAEAVPINILYEDDYLLVVDKAAGIATIPSRNQPSHTLANGILYYYQQSQIDATIHVVTRLDTDTSGIVLIAKNPYSHSLFARLQKQDGIKRVYQAIVHGHVYEKSATIDEAIGRKEGSIIERAVVATGQRAITHYEVMSEQDTSSILRVKLETGRTHQIRVHFSYIGHPLVGDDLYGGKQDKIKRQALHCAEVSFIHPFTKQLCQFTSELPNDMKKMLEQDDECPPKNV
ncbi:MAG TPA: RluA family pseudouridine synthase [Pseudogracilibacillus sp.]|nr:RluA family pseudouridine synthase [Pseudogracilibacillus sp.]